MRAAGNFPSTSRRLQRLIRESPSPPLARTNLAKLAEIGGSRSIERIPAARLPALIKLLGGSSYLSDALIQEGKGWPRVFLEQLNRPRRRVEDHFALLAPMLDRAGSFDEFSKVLRQHKKREFIGIGLKDLLSSHSVEETTMELTALAEGSLDAACRFCRREVEREFGPLLLPETSRPNRFVVLGMGKFGGEELNFSSDIDLIYLYEEDSGESQSGINGRAIPARFFARLAEMVTNALGEVTEEGFVFRVDLRLRPFGRDGPLVHSCASALLYYESWGQCWERAAMIKARPVAGDKELGHEFLRDMGSFIYRRYLDFATVEELRHMKARIEREILRPEEKDRNVKLGYGGIREIEFFTQALQLVNGGYEPAIRERNTVKALDLLARYGHIPPKEKENLTSAYRFLRDVEHKVQMVDQAQTHSIPNGEEAERALARRLNRFQREDGKSERALFWQAYRTHTARVHAAFDRLFYSAQEEISRENLPGPGTVWNDLDQESLVIDDLRRLGFSDPERAYRHLLAVRDGEPYSPPSPRRLKVMRALGPALMAEIARALSPDRALFNLAEFSHKVGARTGFLSLLAENPKTLRLVITLFGSSQFLSDLFIARPELLDSLIRVDLAQAQKTRKEMTAELMRAVEANSDLEEKLNVLRRYKSEEFLRIGLHDLGGRLELEECIQQLSDLADACLECGLRLSLDEVERSHGKTKRGRFAVFGMGKLGGQEIDYGSDLDLIFLYDAPGDAKSSGGRAGPITAHEYYMKVGQKLLSFLCSPTEEGIAYQIDMRLRPSGRFGPLVSSLSAYRDYHRVSSELWERQALIKMRFVAGARSLGARVGAMVGEFAYRNELTDEEVAQIHHLRMRMERELAQESAFRFNLKKGKGGLVDVEFITQMLQLSHGWRFPEVRLGSTLEALKALYLAKIINRRDYVTLSEGYLFLRQLDHRLRLERSQSIDILEREGEKLDGIALALGYQQPGKPGRKRSGNLLLGDYERKRDRIRSCYERFFPSGDSVSPTEE